MVGITKIKKINNVGIFDGFTWPSDCELSFSKINMLYGYNGSGKTNLSNIMGLFSEEYDELERKSIALNMSSDSSKDVEIEIEWDGKTAKFPKEKKKLCVFNSDFIANHVYDGSQAKVKSFKAGVITEEQLSNPALKAIVNAIDTENKRKKYVDDYIGELTKLAKDIKDTLSKTWNENIDGHRMPTNLDLKNCLEKASDESEEDLKKELDEEFSKFKISKNQDVLEQDISDLKQIVSLNIDFPNDLKDTIQKSIPQTAREKIQEKINAFKEHRLKHTTIQNWFDDGSDLLKRNKDKGTCPLCDSKILDIEALIASYDTFFNDELAGLKTELEGIINSIGNLIEDLSKRQAQTASLKTILVRYGCQDFINEEETAALQRLISQTAKKLLNAAKKIFETKKDAIDFSPTDDQLNQIDGMLLAFEQFKLDVSTLSSIKDNVLEKLSNSRFDAKSAKDICKKLFWKSFDIQGLKKSNEWHKQEKLEIDENTGGIACYKFLKNLLQTVIQIITDKETEKNSELAKLKKESEYVNAFLARLCVTNFTVNIPEDGDITINYLGVSPKKGIQYSLSEGEKTALAFAYFLSKYKHEIIDNKDAKQEDYIIIIDDPVSSLDENRLFSTAIIIQDFLMPKAIVTGKGEDKVISWNGSKQLFIFSHNIVFLKFMGNIINSDQNKGRVDYYLDKGKISLLPKLFQNYQTSYFYKFSKIQKFAEGNIGYEEVKDSLPNYIRITLESFIAFKFVRLRGKDKYLPAMFDALIKHINHCDLNHYKPVDLIKDKAALTTALQRIQHKVNPESHGNAP